MEHGLQSKISRRGENKFIMNRRKLQFLHLEIHRVRFLFRLLVGGNLFAHGAGMLAIEGIADGFGQAALLKIVREHRRPGHGLKYRPMAADSREERGYDKQMADTTKHMKMFVEGAKASQARRLKIHSKNPSGTGTS